jgi:cytochrome c2/peptidoglycan hydrolase CwlO-like protein
MPPKSPSLYNLNKTTVIFAIASVVLLIGLVWMVVQDSSREWKDWQRKFMDYSRQQAEAQLAESRKKVDQKKLEELQASVKQAQQDIKARRKEIKALQSEIGKLDVELIKAKGKYQDLKQVYESERYFFEEARAHGHKEEAAKLEKKLAAGAPELRKIQVGMEEAQARVDAKNAELSKITGAEQAASREITKLQLEQSVLEKKIKKLKPDFAKAILNAPMLDFIRPTLRIQQIVVENLYDDFYFNKANKVDRCITCHLGIDQKGLENAPAPFKSHPNLDLFLTSNSPHPMEKFGCTVCHGGSGHSATFTTAAHTPRDETQAKEWKKKYHWQEMKHWTEKMLPANHLEAACVKCHQGVSEVPQAPKLNKGRDIAESFGCYGCHKVEGMDRWKVGPSLMHVQSKLEQDWIVRWLQNPKEFRPSTKMPRVFHLSNTSDPASAEKNNAAIAGIASYLIKNSDPITLTAPPLQGDAKKGEELVKTLGCTGCHTAGDQAANDHGPELIGLGSKVKPEWLYSWLKNPKAYHPETRMPSLRLSDEEASHITSYLLSLRNEKFESLQLPLVKPEAVDELAMSFMSGTMRQEEIKAELGKMSPEQKLEFVGKKSISHQGCFGCHDIKGFEKAKPIGTELTEEGSKDIHKLYFGFVHLQHTRQAWFFQKLKEPRIFDKGKELPYLEKLRMPQFDFTDEQAESLVTFLLSQQKASIPKEMRKELDLREQHIEAGRLYVNKFNCNGCHTLDGKEGRARQLFEDKGNAPPIIDGEGRKVQSDWLYQFLHEPTTIRPWLKYRMPTFGFSDQGLAALVQYFTMLDQVPPDFAPQDPHSTPEEIAAGRQLFKTLQCIKCHKSNPEPGLSASFLAPDLVMSKERLRAGWVADWINDPQALQPGTMMPTFFSEGQSPVQDVYGGDAAKQIKAMRDYLWTFTPEEAAALQQASVPAKK